MSDLLSQLSALLTKMVALFGGGVSGTANTQSTAQNSSNYKSTQNGTYTSVKLRGGYVEQKTNTGCFDACDQMAGYKPNPANRIITANFNGDGQLSTQARAQQGIQTIDSYLASGRPIEVGLNINGGKEPLNRGHEQTQHGVVIDGSGTDAGGRYYHFVDPYRGHGMSSDNKLYLNSDNSLSGRALMELENHLFLPRLDQNKYAKKEMPIHGSSSISDCSNWRSFLLPQ